MKRGTSEHQHNEAAQFLGSPYVQAKRERMHEVIIARCRSVDLSDADACRSVLALLQQNETFWSLMDQDAQSLEQREAAQVREVV